MTFPSDFADFEPFADWSLATETGRNHRRISVTQAEIKTFAAAMLPRVDAITAHLDRFALDALPAPETRLMYLLLSLAEIAPSIESYNQPTVPDGYDSRRFAADETFKLRPRI